MAWQRTDGDSDRPSGESSPGWFRYSADTLNRAGGALLGAADRVEDLAGRSPLGGSGGYGHVGLAGAAATYEARLRFLHRQVAHEVEHAGYELRGTAQAYEMTDMYASDRMAPVDIDYLMTGKKSRP